MHGLEVYGYHGVSSEERTVGHRYVADVTLDVAGGADRTDRIGDTVNYAELADLVSKRIGMAQYQTVERLARDVCEAVLATYPAVQEIHIALAKRLPPLPHIAELAGVELTISRSAERKK